MTETQANDVEMTIAPTEQPAQEKRERPPPVKQGRVIVRNLGFDLREKHLRGQFSRFGPITAVDVPLNQTNNQNRGFGFIEFAQKADAQKAITEMSGQKWKGRAITVEFSLPKNSYETKVQHVLDNTNQTK